MRQVEPRAGVPGTRSVKGRVRRLTREWARRQGNEALTRLARALRRAAGCAMCGRDLEWREAVIEHSHDNGAVRGMACRRCNAIDGWERRRALRVRVRAKPLETWTAGELERYVEGVGRKTGLGARARAYLTGERLAAQMKMI